MFDPEEGSNENKKQNEVWQVMSWIYIIPHWLYLSPVLGLSLVEKDMYFDSSFSQTSLFHTPGCSYNNFIINSAWWLHGEMLRIQQLGFFSLIASIKEGSSLILHLWPHWQKCGWCPHEASYHHLYHRGKLRTLSIQVTKHLWHTSCHWAMSCGRPSDEKETALVIEDLSEISGDRLANNKLTREAE